MEVMNPGIDLDRKVASQVFGMYWNYHDMDLCPNYSTDIAAAWKIVRKFEEEGKALHLDNNDFETIDGKNRRLWTVQNYITEWGGHDELGLGWHYESKCIQIKQESFSHALCLFALEAMEN